MIAKIYLTLAFVIVSATSAIGFSASASAAGCGGTVLGFVPWYQHLTYEKNGNCEMRPVTEKAGVANKVSLTAFIWTVALNVVQILLTAVAYVTIFFIIKGGFHYITSQGDSAGMSSAKQNIQNAIIGLIIALLAASIVNAIAGAIPK